MSHPLLARLPLKPRIENAWSTAMDFLDRDFNGIHWTGELSTSALSTATAISALCMVRNSGGSDRQSLTKAIDDGCRWLAEHQNADGGFGDTDRSHSNIATSFLVQAAWKLAEYQCPSAGQAKALVDYIESRGKWDALRQRYGKDKTFVVPIMTNCALAGLIDWRHVPSLPFEAAWLPQSWYRLARLPVVSYAIPALVGIGQAKFHFDPPWNPLTRWIRKQAILPTLGVLKRMQPASGGYLEAVPLTSFVLMSLAATGKVQLDVAQQCTRFILESRLSDGSWPIDTNLATWVTSLSVVSLSRRFQSPLRLRHAQPPQPTTSVPTSFAHTSGQLNSATLRWLLACQHLKYHPFTGASPGGWGWTNLSGAVPDSDDTPAALIAISKMDLAIDSAGSLRYRALLAVGRSLEWLIRLQNRNGGWPTFCRGWGKLPFDRSGTDLTAHALRAFHAWLPRWNDVYQVHPNTPAPAVISSAMQRGIEYLQQTQQHDGSWFPLWFGNQDHDAEENPIYGTAKVVIALAELGLHNDPMLVKGREFLCRVQNADGGWGGGPSVDYSGLLKYDGRISTIEETGLALEALIGCGGGSQVRPIIMRGLCWLVGAIEGGNLSRSWPIGFYFAKLWYHEKLYPAIFSIAALGSALCDVPDLDEFDEVCENGQASWS